MEPNDYLQRIRYTDQFIIDEDGNLVGIKNPKAQGRDLRPYPEIGPLYKSNSATAATYNTGAIQAALNAGGLVQILAPGTYYINSTLTIYSDTKLLLGAGVVLKNYGTGNARSMIRNSCYSSSIKSVSAISSASAATTTGYRRATASATAHGFAVGNWVLIKGDTSGNGGSFNGIWLVDTVPDANSFTFLFNNKLDPSAAAGTLTAALANANITIEGGRLDYNNAANTTVAVGTDQCAVILNKIKNGWILNQEGYNGLKYMWHMANCQDCGGTNLTLNTGSDGFHIKAPAWNTRVTNVAGQSGDDMVAFVTIDVLDSTINPPDTGGDIRGIEVTNVTGWHASGGRCVTVVANAGNKISGVKIDGIHSFESNYIAVFLGVDGTESGTIQDADVRNISGGFASAAAGASAVVLGGASSVGTLTLGNIMVDGIKPRDPSSYQLVSCTGRVTFSEVSIKNVKQRPLSLVSAIVFNGANVIGDTVNVEDCRADFDLTNAAGNCRLVETSSTTIKRTRISKSSVYGTGSTRVGYFLIVFTPGASCRYEVVDSEIAGNCQMAELSTITNAPTLYYRGVTYNCANYFQSCGQDVNIIASDIDILAAVDIFIIAGTSKTVSFNCTNFRINGENFCTSYGTTNTISWAGGDGSFRLNFDASKFTFASGSLFYNTNAAYGAGVGMYAYGAAGSTRIAA